MHPLASIGRLGSGGTARSCCGVRPRVSCRGGDYARTGLRIELDVVEVRALVRSEHQLCLNAMHDDMQTSCSTHETSRCAPTKQVRKGLSATSCKIVSLSLHLPFMASPLSYLLRRPWSNHRPNTQQHKCIGLSSDHIYASADSNKHGC